MKCNYYYQMASAFTAEEVMEMITADDDVQEHFDLGSDNELEFDNYDE